MHRQGYGANGMLILPLLVGGQFGTTPLEKDWVVPTNATHVHGDDPVTPLPGSHP